MSTNLPHESEWLAAARKGDRAALGQLVKPLYQPVCAFLVKQELATEFDVEDVFMDAVLRVMKKLDTFEGTCSFASWFVTIAKNIARDRLRKQAHTPVSMNDSLDASGETALLETVSASGESTYLPLEPVTRAPSLAEEPGASLELKDRSSVLFKYMKKLSREHQQVLHLFYFQQLKYKEIADQLGIAQGTVMSRLNNAKNKLKEFLSPHYEELFPG